MTINVTTSMSQNSVPASSDGSGRSAVAAETRQATTEQRPEMRQAAADVKQAEPALNEPALNEVSQAVSEINDYLQSVNRELHFRVDEALPLGRAVISIIDSDTQETIREIPSKEALMLAQRLQEERLSEAANIGGLFISDQA